MGPFFLLCRKYIWRTQVEGVRGTRTTGCRKSLPRSRKWDVTGRILWSAWTACKTLGKNLPNNNTFNNISKMGIFPPWNIHVNIPILSLGVFVKTNKQTLHLTKMVLEWVDYCWSFINTFYREKNIYIYIIISPSPCLSRPEMHGCCIDPVALNSSLNRGCWSHSFSSCVEVVHELLSLFSLSPT